MLCQLFIKNNKCRHRGGIAKNNIEVLSYSIIYILYYSTKSEIYTTQFQKKIKLTTTEKKSPRANRGANPKMK